VFDILASATFSASSAIGSVVYTANVTDAEGDPVVMTLTCEPTGCPFTVNNGKDLIHVLQVLNYLYFA